MCRTAIMSEWTICTSAIWKNGSANLTTHKRQSAYPPSVGLWKRSLKLTMRSCSSCMRFIKFLRTEHIEDTSLLYLIEKINHLKINRGRSRKIPRKMHLKINRKVCARPLRKTLTQDLQQRYVRKTVTQDVRARPSRNVTQDNLRKIKLG